MEGRRPSRGREDGGRRKGRGGGQKPRRGMGRREEEGPGRGDGRRPRRGGGRRPRRGRVGTARGRPSPPRSRQRSYAGCRLLRRSYLRRRILGPFREAALIKPKHVSILLSKTDAGGPGCESRSDLGHCRRDLRPKTHDPSLRVDSRTPTDQPVLTRLK